MFLVGWWWGVDGGDGGRGGRDELLPAGDAGLGGLGGLGGLVVVGFGGGKGRENLRLSAGVEGNGQGNFFSSGGDRMIEAYSLIDSDFFCCRFGVFCVYFVDFV